jgi:hypothetical protein
MRWAGHEKMNTYRIFVGHPEGDYQEELGIDRMIILRWILER